MIFNYKGWTAFLSIIPKEKRKYGYYYNIKLFAPNFSYTEFKAKRCGWKAEVKSIIKAFEDYDESEYKYGH